MTVATVLVEMLEWMTVVTVMVEMLEWMAVATVTVTMLLRIVMATAMALLQMIAAVYVQVVTQVMWLIVMSIVTVTAA